MNFVDLENAFEARVNELVRKTEELERLGSPCLKWVLNQTPDGPIPS